MSAVLKEEPQPMVEIRLREAQAGDASRWDAFVQAHDKGTFFHLFGWKTVIERTFGHPSRYLIAESDSGVHGVFHWCMSKVCCLATH